MTRTVLAGLVTCRWNRITQDWVSIYIASEAGIDVSDKYAVVCEKHGQIVSSSKLESAREIMMAQPVDFCSDCAIQERMQE